MQASRAQGLSARCAAPRGVPVGLGAGGARRSLCPTLSGNNQHPSGAARHQDGGGDEQRAYERGKLRGARPPTGAAPRPGSRRTVADERESDVTPDHGWFTLLNHRAWPCGDSGKV